MFLSIIIALCRSVICGSNLYLEWNNAASFRDIIFIIEKSAYIPRNIQTSLGNYIIVQQQNNKEIEKQLREKKIDVIFFIKR